MSTLTHSHRYSPKHLINAEQSYALTINKSGLKELLEVIGKDKYGPFVVCKATGGYERALMGVLHDA